MGKFLRYFLAIVMLVSCFAGSGLADQGTVVSVAVSGSASEIAVRQEIADLYMKENPDVKIEFIDLGDDRVTKMMTLISSGTAPDVMYINENVVTYASRGVMEPLNSYIEGEGAGYLDYFYESLVSLDTWNGNIYALPQEVSPYVVYYNKDLFNQYGVTLPTDEWTFDEWYKAVSDIAKAGAANGVYGQNLMSWADHYLMILSRLGVEIYTAEAKDLWIAQPENYDKALAAFQFLQDAYMVDKVCPTPSEITAMGEGFSQTFRNQQVAMQAAGLWDLPTYKDEPLSFDWDVVMSPYSQDGTRTTRAGILNWGIYSGSKNKDAAWDFLKFMVGHEGQMIIAKHNMALPSAHDEEANQMILDSHFPPNVVAFIKSADFVQQGDSFSVCEDEINNELTAEISSMVLGQETAKEALDNVIEFSKSALEDAMASINQ